MSELHEVLAGIPGIDEGVFHYYEISKYFDVTLSTLPANAVVPPHRHDVTVHNHVLEGEFIVQSSGTEKVYSKAEWVSIPKGSEHGVRTSVDTVLLELWGKK